ncbi:hypothetical protein RN001_013508 [Aquatica leii]|uniref:Dynein regulatory complex protein 1 n=1 Tax=Aquatica leii TaxID=1421715 RepID=A0AAN7P2X3_9COLE|nr:hypothetical protein RN001_013508 [Aquatica leii]
MDDETNENEIEEKEPQVTSSDPNERKLARRLRIERRLEAIRKLNMPEGDEEEETVKKTLLQEQLQKSYELLAKLTIETLECVSNVKVANESREINRREIEDINREKILEYLEEEAKSAEEHFNVIDEKWLQIFNYNDPLLINEEIMTQKEKCDVLIKKKDEVIARLKNEVTVSEDKFNEDQKKQLADIQTLTDRIEKQLVLMRRAYTQELEIIEDVLMVERKILIDATDRRWEELHKKRDLEENLNCEKKFQQLEEFEEICTKLRVDHQEKYRDIKIKLGNNIENLQCELQKIKNIALLNNEKLDYNYQVLKKREAENLLIRSQQKRKINKMQDAINSLRTKIRNYTVQTNEQIDKLTLEVQKLHASVLDIEAKADSFCKINDVKYQQVWDFNKERVTSLVQQLLNTDRVLYEQQLGLKWTNPEMVLIDKCDLPSYKSALQIVTEVCRKTSCKSTMKESVDAQQPSTESSSIQGETMAHRRILRIILKLIADKSGFLIEEKLRDVLKPYSDNEKALVRIDNVFSALEIKHKQDIEILLEFFLPYTHCPICMHSSITNLETSETVLRTYDFANESEDTSEVQIGKTVLLLKISKALPSVAMKTSCYRKHPLVISSVYILRALREFLSKFYVAKDSIITMASRLSHKRSTVSRLMADDDVKMYWDRYRKVFSSDNEEVWDALYIGLQKYHAILKDRKKLNDEVVELRRQHSELKQMLSSYEKEDKEKIKPPCARQREVPINPTII